MTTLGEAYVEVHADTKPFAKELDKQIRSILKKMDVTVGTEGVKIGATLGKGVADGMDKETDRSLLSWQRRFVLWARETGRKGFDEFEGSFRRMAKGNFILFRVLGNLGERMLSISRTFLKVTKSAYDFGKSLLQANRAMISLGFEGIKSLLGFANDFSRSLASAQQAGANLVGAITSLAASAATGAAGLAAMAAAMVLLISAMAALAAILIVAAAPFAALLGFALALPAALSVMFAIIAPLTIALRDLGDALDLVFESDPKKLADGLKKLTPTMQSLVMGLRTVAPLLKAIQTTVQKAFFGPVMMSLIPAIRSVAPLLQRGLSLAARAMGMFVANALTLVDHPAFRRFIDELFPTVARMIDTMGPPIIRLMVALANAATAALPTVELLIGKLGGFIDSFATWIEDAIADGRFQQFLDDAIASAQSIWNLVKALIALFAEMFMQTDEGGRKFLDKITQAINKFTTWLKSPDGKQALAEAVVLALAFAAAFSLALKVIRIVVTELSRAVGIAVTLLRLLGIIEAKKNPGAGVAGGAQAGVNQFSGGGVVGYDQLAMVHKGEPILDPANSPDKNRGILAEAGMLDLLTQPSVTNVYIGNRQLDAYVDYRIQQNNRVTASSLRSGSRR